VDSSHAGRHVDTFPAEPLVSVASSDRGSCSPRDKITRYEESPRNPPMSVDNQTRNTVSCLLVASAYLSVGSKVQVGPLPSVCFSSSYIVLDGKGGCLVSPDNCIALFLFNKTNRRANFPNLFLSRNSTYFGQFLSPSSGIFHCTFGTSIYHAGLTTYTSAECTVENS
jgi:hypothetical protein